MSETFFPVNDLLRRKLQTTLTVATVTLSVASTLFLILISDRVGFGVASTAEMLTTGLSAIFAQFLLLVGILIFTIGTVITSFIVFLTMKQRTKDFGLIKAAGCPNGLVFAYFIIELLIITLVGCVLGVVLGFIADFAIANFSGFQAYQKPPNLWFAPLVFAIFFVLAITFGTKPLFDAARASPAKLLSSVEYFGLSTGDRLKPLSKIGITLRLAARSLFRRGSASIRIIVLLSIVFILLTVSISGSIIANDTTKNWISNAVGQNLILIAQKDLIIQYKLLLSQSFSGVEASYFDFADERLAVPDLILEEVNATPGLSNIDMRLILKEQIQEMRGYKIDPESQSTTSVGDNRSGISLFIGVEPGKMLTNLFVTGQFLNSTDSKEAVIGDTLAQAMFSPDPTATPPINFSDPLLQNVILNDRILDIIGVCVDPINRGNVTYVPLETLQNITGISNVNLIFAKLDASVDRATTLAQLRESVQNVNSKFSVFELDEVLQKNLAFLGSIWSEIMLLPLLTSASAALCLVGYMMLSVDEQRQEFGVLRAIGAKPNTIIEVVSVQSILVLFASFAVGISFGVIITLMILIPHPVVTSFTILEIVAWLFVALAGMFFLSLWPAMRFARKPILKIMS
jgi:ABC-type antimicrobial peptide transport system permease subunit